MRYALTLVAATLALAFIGASSALAAEGTPKPKVMQGFIHKVDISAGTFVLGGKNESQTPFRFGVKRGEREVTVFLDGQKTTREAMKKPKCKSSVTYIKVGDVLWAVKVEITSPAN